VGLTSILVVTGFLLAQLAWPLALVPLAGIVFVFSFFRDPERTPPDAPDLVASPADGTISDVQEVEAPPLIGEPCLRIGIFLSVFNVHVNRAPIRGTVTRSEYRPGRFLDARHPDASERNEARDTLIEGRYPVLVRQISGLIARRIVFPFAVGDTLERGQRMGMIKFGSRTELYLPRRLRPEALVRVGDKVQGAATAIARVPPADSAEEAP
jgi:phosphatidylserine decarboxylase